MKIAIIEDRAKRLQQFQSFDISNESSIVVITEQLFQELIDNLKANDLTLLHQYDVVAVHRSAMSETIRDTIKKYCAKTRKPLVFFSGGITSSYYKETGFPFLLMNSKEFYSDHLKIFIDHINQSGKPNLLMLQFGAKWKLSMLLSLRNRIAVSLSKEGLKATGVSDIGTSGLIKWMGNLELSELIITDLETEKTKGILRKNADASVSLTELEQIKIAIEQQLQKML